MLLRVPLPLSAPFAAPIRPMASTIYVSGAGFKREKPVHCLLTWGYWAVYAHRTIEINLSGRCCEPLLHRAGQRLGACGNPPRARGRLFLRPGAAARWPGRGAGRLPPAAPAAFLRLPRRVPVRCRAPLPGANAGKGAFDKSIPGVDAPSVKRTCERMTARPAFRTLRLGYFFCMLSAVSVSCAKGNNAIGKENRGRGMGAVVSSGGRHGLEGRWRSSLRDGGRNYGSISYSCNTEASVIS